jgi:glycosyltransferase involved in cell wall biosynthesis
LEETGLFAMRLAIINLTGGGLSGGGTKTMRYLIPCLQNEIRASKVRVFVPSNGPDLTLLAKQGIKALPEWDWMKGFHWLRQEIRAFAPDAIYVPNAIWLNFGNVPSVVMVRNMEALLRPFGGNPISAGIKNLLRREMARYACRNATRIIAISQFVHDFLVEKWRIPSWKIDVIHHGIESLSSSQKTVKPSRLDKLKVGQFLFTAGSMVYHRGIEDTIQAINLLKERYPSHKLLIAGESVRGTSGYEKRMKQLVDEFGLSSRVIWLGHLSQAEMSWCFYHCEAFVMTSRIEACPNIVLEAMSHGCINISTSCPPMPEIFGDGALYYNADCPEDLAEQIVRVRSLTSAKKTAMRDRARCISGRFKWTLTAKKTFDTLETAIKHKEKAV